MEPVAALATPEPPPRVTRQLTRRTGEPGIGSAFAVVFIPHFWIGIGLACAAVWQLAFPFVSRPVEGHVTSKSESTSAKTHQTSYTLSVAYDLDDVPGTVAVGVGHDAYLHANVGDTVPLEGARIASFTSAQREGSTLFPVLLPMAAFWNFDVGVFVYTLAWVPLSRWWLVKRGVRAHGKVTHAERTTGKGAGVTLTYEFRTEPDGVVVTGTMKVLPKRYDAAAIAEGSEVTVFHHPTRPRLSVIYELTSWEVLGGPSSEEMSAAGRLV